MESQLYSQFPDCIKTMICKYVFMGLFLTQLLFFIIKTVVWKFFFSIFQKFQYSFKTFASSFLQSGHHLDTLTILGLWKFALSNSVQLTHLFWSKTWENLSFDTFAFTNSRRSQEDSTPCGGKKLVHIVAGAENRVLAVCCIKNRG